MADSTYTAPGFPSLYWPPQDYSYTLANLSDIWKFTLIWTVIIYAIFHIGVAAIALGMQIGKPRSNWKYLWIVPVTYTLIAGSQALLAGSIVGLMLVFLLYTVSISVENH